MEKVNISELILDFSIYPRHEINSFHISEIIEALRSGSEFPPIIVDKKSKRIVDGFHRYKAFVSHFGHECEIEVILKQYKSEEDIFLDALRYNSKHGRRLSTIDWAHCILRGNELKIEKEVIANALNITKERVDNIVKTRFGSAKNESIKGNITEVIDEKTKNGKITKTHPVLLKPALVHKSKSILTKKQEEINNTLGAYKQTYYFKIPILIIENDLLDTENTEVMEYCKKLSKLLEKVLGVLVG